MSEVGESQYCRGRYRRRRFGVSGHGSIFGMSGIAERLYEVKERIAQAARRANRNPESVEIMAVTKTYDLSAINDAVGAGITLIGENRVQEALAKVPEGERGYRLNLIGHLQRNKAKFVPGFFDCVESIDKTQTAEALEKCCTERKTAVDVLLEVNTSGEESKSGFRTIDSLRETVDAVAEMEFLHCRGLMTIAPFTDDADEIRRSFSNLRRIFEETSARLKLPEFDTLSMGMSSDFEIAVEEGSTRVRLGTALFGERS